MDLESDRKRIATRYVFEKWMWIRRGPAGKQTSVRGWTRDLSESGLAAFVAQSLLPGESVILEIPLTSEKPLQVGARVARTLGTQYGFQFVALSVEQRQQIREALRDARPLAGPSLTKDLSSKV